MILIMKWGGGIFYVNKENHEILKEDITGPLG